MSSWDFPKYPDNWEDMREAMFMAYGGKYCAKGFFRKWGHKGYIQLHHYVPLSKAKYPPEYYFLNQEWNLVPLCEKHHKQYHNHISEVRGVYNPEYRPRHKKVSYLRRAYWAIKRLVYKRKFNKREKGEKVLHFWNYLGIGERRLKKKMKEWPKKYLEDLVSE